ncbi:NUC173 domain-containing protein [Lineolata rhizophorae]|uniref:NUC173 domain-containing protein n=1 Tax=Lineolata rhizophorae TaxID=578093 RepID=A0A6A6P8C9_9PEZI|nr:NUC173 domain-containing protein [Lineolata rhizophorae]
MSLDAKLDKIRSSPKLQNQQQASIPTAVVLSAIEETLRTQKSEATPTAYFAALLSLLGQHISAEKGIVNKDIATSVVYLLDLVTPHVPAPLLRSKFSQILLSLAPALTNLEAEAPLLRSSIGCLESLLVVQDSQAWALPQSQIGPRRAVAGLLTIAVDHRPKVRKRAQEALSQILRHPPPSPSVDHPAADMCAESALQTLKDVSDAASRGKKHRLQREGQGHEPGLVHCLQLVKTIASASGGWPSRKIDSLCELLLGISRSSNEYLTMASFEIFETIFERVANEATSVKLPRLLEVIGEMQPSRNDTQLLPPWIAVLSRGYDVSAQINPKETFQKLPALFSMVSEFLSSPSHNIRVSASECLVSFSVNCIPDSVLVDPSVYDEEVLGKLSKIALDLLSVKHQAAWMEIFTVESALMDALKWRSSPLLSGVIRTVGDLRSNESFHGKKEADAVISRAIFNAGPEAVLQILPLNLAKSAPDQPGRAWLLPLLRDSVHNARLGHFKSELVPLSEAIFQRVLNHGNAEKTVEIKIFETIVHQIWAALPGYCDKPLDVLEAFDQSFAELLCNLLYQQTELRTDLCRALSNLVMSFREMADLPGEEDDLVLQWRIPKADARRNIGHLSGFASNLLAVLFNVYSETLPQYRFIILNCINDYLSITPEKDLSDTFNRVVSTLDSSLSESGSQTQADKQKRGKETNRMPPMSHTLMDLVITISIYLPRGSFGSLFQIAAVILNKDDDPQLQKKAYKLIPRLATSDVGRSALRERNEELQAFILKSTEKVSAPARRDRLAAIAEIVRYLPPEGMHFVPLVLSEVVIAAKEVNEKARSNAFDLLILMGERMRGGGIINNSRVSYMPQDEPSRPASLEEYFTMVSSGLAATTPHMVSATITTLSRILYQFHDQLPQTVIVDLVQTVDLFLTSPNREIVRSVLGFVKVCVVSLPADIVKPRLETLIPNLTEWSHEHKSRFRSKVKHILERMIRRFGVDVVERHCPPADRKIITNIRKSRDRKKRRKDAAGDGEEEDEAGVKPSSCKGKFESEFDEAVYGSGSDSEGFETDFSEDEMSDRRSGGNGRSMGQAYIIEDQDEPLDLLDRKALGNISSSKPLPQQRQRLAKNPRAKVDVDGKLILRDDSDKDDATMIDIGPDGNPGDGSLEGGINAYVNAIRGRDAARRGRGGRLKFSNRRSGDDDEMEVDEGEVSDKLKAKGKGLEKGKDFKAQQRGLGAHKTRGGRVNKGVAPHGRGRR